MPPMNRDNTHLEQQVLDWKPSRPPSQSEIDFARGVILGQAPLNCRMTMDAFQLSVDVIRGKEVLLSKLIVTTTPDEAFFHRKVDTIDFFEDRIRVWGKHDTLVGEILLSEIPL